MDQIRDNERTLRDAIQRHDYSDVSVVDIFTAFNVLANKTLDVSSLTDDKYFTFLMGVVSRVPRGREREYFFDKMFQYYEKISGIDPASPNWLLLQASLVYLAPVGSGVGVIDRLQFA